MRMGREHEDHCPEDFAGHPGGRRGFPAGPGADRGGLCRCRGGDGGSILDHPGDPDAAHAGVGGDTGRSGTVPGAPGAAFRQGAEVATPADRPFPRLRGEGFPAPSGGEGSGSLGPAPGDDDAGTSRGRGAPPAGHHGYLPLRP
ncbi:hypothetical protein ACFFX0_01395 [Citricoccus parietis]|uniref:Uncharacterized protein n=1 Tax=Citricoccus parietis TaxID=592307 RepID=A0ABV5FTY6_9MICC